MLMLQQAVQKNINIGNKIMAPAKRAVFAVLTGVLSTYSRDREQALLSVSQLNRLYTRNLLFSAKSLCTEQKSVPQSFGIKPQPNMSLVQVGPDLLFDNGIQH